MLPNTDKIKTFTIIGILCLFLFTGCQPAVDHELTLTGENLTEAWRFQSAGAINQKPLWVNNMLVFVPHGGTLTALDATTGELRWELAEEWDVWERSYATDGNLIFVGVQGGKMVAVESRSGKIRWTTDLGINTQIRPLVVDSRIYISTTFVGAGLDKNLEGKAKLFVLNTKNGDEIWSFQTDNYALQTPTLYENILYVGGSYYAPEEVKSDEGGPMRIYALDTTTKTERWRYQSLDGFIKTMYASQDSVVYIAYEDYINGVDAQTGELSWRRNTGNWVPSLFGFEDTVYFGAANTIVYAYDAASGELTWQYNIPEGTFNYVAGSPVRVKDDLYMLTQHGDIIAINALDSSPLWNLPTGVTPRDGLTVANGWLYFGDIEGVVYGYTSK